MIGNLDNAFQIACERMQKLAGDTAKNTHLTKRAVKHFEKVDKLFAARNGF
ncbi:hypothetical protein ABBQ32_011594 [Trebouxia sp. C0010 RCD-2024]